MNIWRNVLVILTTGVLATYAGAATALPIHTTTVEAGAQAGTFTVAMATLGSQTFVVRLNASSEKPVNMAWGDTLLRVDSKSRRLLPNLVVKWSNAKRGNDWIWRFQLRRGIRFNEGQGPLTSVDVKFTFRQCLRPDVTNAACPVLSAAIDGDIKNFTVAGPYTFSLHSSQAVPSLPYFLSNGVGNVVPIMASRYYSRVGDAGFAAHPIGTGPFIFKSNSIGEGVTLTAVPHHFRQTPRYKTLRILAVPEVSTRLAMLRSGAANMAEMTIPLKRQILDARLKLWRIPNIGNAFVALGGMFYDLPDKNCTTCPWVGYTDKARKVRQALSLAIDRKAILSRFLLGEGRLSPLPFSWTPGPYAFNDPKRPLPRYDAAHAKRLLRQAGYPNGFSIDLASFPLPQLANLPDVDELIATYWEAIGINVKRAHFGTFNAFRSKMQTRDTRGLAWGIVSSFVDDPVGDLFRLYSKNGVVAYLHDRQFDKFIRQASQTFGADERAALARKAGDYILKQSLGIPLFSINQLVATTRKVKSWQPLQGEPRLTNFEYVTLS
jgi:peptide/nickel transport system substrate-binding protein